MTIEEALPEPVNPVGVDGLEFVEYATPRPQEFGALLQKLGFQAVGRHRSREVVLYRNPDETLPEPAKRTWTSRD